jgi:hypothetical protein
MARRGQPAEEEPVEDTEAMEAADAGESEEAAPAATEFVPEQTHKPKSDVYSLILILTFLAFLTGCIVAGREAWENYDVQFWVFNKEKAKAVEAPSSSGGNTSAPPEKAPETPMK